MEVCVPNVVRAHMSVRRERNHVLSPVNFFS
jgi:hypothetical protein